LLAEQLQVEPEDEGFDALDDTVLLEATELKTVLEVPDWEEAGRELPELLDRALDPELTGPKELLDAEPLEDLDWEEAGALELPELLDSIELEALDAELTGPEELLIAEPLEDPDWEEAGAFELPELLDSTELETLDAELTGPKELLKAAELESTAEDEGSTELNEKMLESEKTLDAEMMELVGMGRGVLLAREEKADEETLPAGRPNAMNSARPTFQEEAETPVMVKRIELVVMAVKLTDVALPSLNNGPTWTTVPSLNWRVPLVIWSLRFGLS
jgi:hypothetical protein